MIIVERLFGLAGLLGGDGLGDFLSGFHHLIISSWDSMVISAAECGDL